MEKRDRAKERMETKPRELSSWGAGGGVGVVRAGERGSWRRARRTERKMGRAVARLLFRAW